IVGWSRDCGVETQYRYYYRSIAGTWAWVDQLAEVPIADIAMTTTAEGRTIPFVVRMERGTVNRFIYSIAMLVPLDEREPGEPDTSPWNGRLLFSLQGGVGIGHTQGSWSESAALYESALEIGYAVVNSTGLRTSSHYNLIRGG